MQYFSKAQKEALKNSTKNFNFLCGAVRSGKTFVSYFMMYLHILQHWNNECFLVGKTLTTLNRNVIEVIRDIFGAQNISKIIDKQYINFFGKKVWCVGANDDRAVTKIQGASAGYMYCDEIVSYPENFFDMMLSRLDKPDSILDATCNPESPSHYIKQWLDKPSTQPYLYNQHFTIYDNPYLSEDTVHRLEDMYRGTIFFDRWILGEWVRTEGLVFPLFNRKRHFLSMAEYISQYHERSKDIALVIVGGDGATTNDRTALVPLIIFRDGQAVVGDIFFHDPKVNGQLSNAQLIPKINQWLKDVERNFEIGGNVPFYTVVDCAAADLVVTMRSLLPPKYNVHPFTKKDIMRNTEVVNNAFAMDMLHIIDTGGYTNYTRRGEKVQELSPLVVELETMIWDEKKADHYDDSVPNDTADAFRYAVCTYFNDPENLWSRIIHQWQIESKM